MSLATFGAEVESGQAFVLYIYEVKSSVWRRSYDGLYAERFDRSETGDFIASAQWEHFCDEWGGAVVQLLDWDS